MFLGIKMTPQGPGKKPVPSVFYCGLNPASLRALHADLVKNNEDGSRFFMIQHPMLVPLQTVITSTEEHADVIAAQEKRKAIAAEAEEKAKDEETVTKPEPLPLINVLERKAELGRMKVRDLQAIVERIKATGQEIETGDGTKAELVDGILKAEGLSLPPEPDAKEVAPPPGKETINAPAA